MFGRHSPLHLELDINSNSVNYNSSELDAIFKNQESAITDKF